jgi:hypothetical protein
MRKAWVLQLFFSLAAHAGEGNPIAVHGFDHMSCGDWRLSRTTGPVREQYIAWVRGIVTGYNYANPDSQITAGRMPDDGALALYIDGYCRDRPMTPFVGAAFALIDELHGKEPTPTAPAAPAAPSPPAASSNAAFQDWLSRQSADLQSLDTVVQHKIYSKENALDSK